MTDSDILDGFSAEEDDENIFDSAGEVVAEVEGGGIDFVPTKAPREPHHGKPRPGEPGYDPKVFQWSRERGKARKKKHVLEFIDLVCNQRLSFRECAVKMGLSYVYVQQHLWKAAKEFVVSDYMSPEEKERLAMLVSTSIEHVLRMSVEKLGESAAYGMVALNAAKELRDLHGITLDKKQDGDGLASLDEIGELVTEAMPALLEHHAAIATIKERQLKGDAHKLALKDTAIEV